jgi:hypothetical protein
MRFMEIFGRCILGVGLLGQLAIFLAHLNCDKATSDLIKQAEVLTAPYSCRLPVLLQINSTLNEAKETDHHESHTVLIES